jgi:excisionase family DNA binding protein
LSLLQNTFHARKPFWDMRVDLSKLITQKEAAKIRGCTPQAINQLVQRGSLKSIEVGGRRLVFKDEVEKFQPSKGGRPKAKGRATEKQIRRK